MLVNEVSRAKPCEENLYFAKSSFYLDNDKNLVSELVAKEADDQRKQFISWGLFFPCLIYKKHNGVKHTDK